MRVQRITVTAGSGYGDEDHYIVEEGVTLAQFAAWWIADRIAEYGAPEDGTAYRITYEGAFIELQDSTGTALEEWVLDSTHTTLLTADDVARVEGATV